MDLLMLDCAYVYICMRVYGVYLVLIDYVSYFPLPVNIVWIHTPSYEFQKWPCGRCEGVGCRGGRFKGGGQGKHTRGGSDQMN
jgi:hypothetical protein